jgi:molybdenum cofactor cytidylyltransferase
MGRPKLLMPWGDERIIERVLRVWCSQVERVAIVMRSSDEQLAAACRPFPVEVVQPQVDPPEMSDSIKAGLLRLRAGCSPADDDGWLLAPADMPQLTDQSIDRVICHFRRRPERVAVAAHQGKRGHPLIAPWARAADVLALQPQQSMRDARRDWPIDDVECGPDVLIDVDTPDQYRRLREQKEASEQ